MGFVPAVELKQNNCIMEGSKLNDAYALKFQSNSLISVPCI